jgi:methyl-accepting chemotaxis protein
MTISKKLYLGFGSIVVILLLLFITNTTVGLRERSARSQASAVVENMQNLAAVQLRTMQVRLSLQDYLLTGDGRERDRMMKEASALAALFNIARPRRQDDPVRDVLFRMEMNERDWMDKFASPLIAERQRVDGGDATAADLQVFYANKDPNAWTLTSMSAVDEANAAIRKTQEDSSAAAAAAQSIGATVSTGVTILAIVLCAGIAYRTAKSITGPLEDTVSVLRSIAAGEGDLTQRVNQSTGDELGEMGKWINTFIIKLESLIGRVATSTRVVAGSSENVFAVSHQMGVGAEETSAQASVVAAAAEQVTRNLQTVAAATEEMTASIAEIAKNASAAATVGTRAVERARVASLTMDHLGRCGVEIGEVVQVISSVAQ